MADLIPIIVQNGINAGSPFVLNHLVKVTNVGPPAELSTIPAQGLTDALSAVDYISVPNAAGTYPAETNAQETFRATGGAIITGSGTDTVQIGRAAAASATNGISIGVSSVSSVTAAVVVGPSATNGGNAGVVIGSTAALSSASGVAIGAGAAVSGNAGGASGIAIGTAASAAGSSAGGGTHIAIGTNAVAKAEDVVICGNASSNQQSSFGVGSVVIGTSATANIAGGSVFAVVIGWSASSTQKLATVLGSGASATAASGQNRAIVIGSGASATGTDAIVIGGGSASAANQEVIIGAGGASIGANTMQLGTASTTITTFVLGRGNTAVTPLARTVRFTNGSGTDNAAGNVTIIAPLSTGNATPASLVFQVGQQVAGSSSTLQTAGNSLILSHTTAGGHNAAFSNSVTIANGLTVSAGGISVTSGNLTMANGGGDIFVGNTSMFRWTSRSRLASGANGRVNMTDGAVTSFTRLTLGPETTGFPALAVNGTELSLVLGDGTAGTQTFVINGSGYGAGVASLRLNGLTSGAGAALGTLTNAPTAGDPAFWIPINIAGTVRYVPAW